MNTDLKVEQIFAAVEELREVAGDGPRARKLLDALFRHVHNLKANASANGLNNLAAAAHEFENVLHSLRTGEPKADCFVNNAIPADLWSSLKQEQKHTLQQSIAEGARLFLVQTSFDVVNFDRHFQSLKDTLSETGEVISTSPRIDNERPTKVNFRILYAGKTEARQKILELSNVSGVTVEEISPPISPIPPQASGELLIPASALERSFEKFSAELVKLPAVPFGGVFQQALQAGRSAAHASGKEIDFKVRGLDLKLDETLCEAVVNALVHLVRNAVDHGIEAGEERVKLGKNRQGKIVIEAASLEEQIIITVTDDGRGIDPESIRLIFRPGFSTAPEVSELSGRGVGLDAVKTGIEEAGGSVSVRSQVGHGSTFEITLPS